jgi:hypothetical protein
MDLPSTIYDLPFLNDASKRAILGGNAQSLFKLDPVYAPWKLEKKTLQQKSARDIASS